MTSPMRLVLCLVAASLALGGLWSPALAEVPALRCGTATRTFTSEPAQRTISEGRVHEFVIDVGGMGPIADIDVVVDLRSSRSGDIEMVLAPPVNGFGPELVLTRGNGGVQVDAFARMTWDDQATADGGAAVTDVDFARFTGDRLPPQVPLARLLGNPANGRWTLRVRDLATNGSRASLLSWSLVVTSASSSPFTRVRTFTATQSGTLTPPNIGTRSSTLVLPNSVGNERVLEAAVRTTLPHADSGQYDVALTSPSGRTVTLTTDNGDRIANAFVDVRWTDRGGIPVTLEADLTPPNDTRSLAPEEPLATFIGEPAAGTWTLSVTDDTAGTTGGPFSWGLEVTTSECVDVRPVVEGESTSTGPVNDTLETATPLALIHGRVARAFGEIRGTGDPDVDVWSFESPQGARLWAFTLVRPRGGAIAPTARMTVLDASGQALASDVGDGSAASGGSVVATWHPAPSIAGQRLSSAGRHYLRVEQLPGVTDLSYELFVVVSAEAPLTDLRGTSPVLGSIGRPIATARGTTADGADTYSVESLVPGSLVLVSVDGDPDRTGSTSNPDLAVSVDAAGARLFSQSNTAPHAEATIVTAVGSSITLQVSNGGIAGAYEVTVAMIRGPNVDLRLTRTLSGIVSLDGQLDVQYALSSVEGIPARAEVFIEVGPDVAFFNTINQIQPPCTVPVAGDTGAVQCRFEALTSASLRVRSTVPLTAPALVRQDAFLSIQDADGGPPVSLDYDRTNDQLRDAIAVQPALANPMLSSASQVDAALPGGLIVYRVGVSNSGPSTSRDVAVTCSLSADAELLSITVPPANWVCLPPLFDAATQESRITCATPALTVLPSTLQELIVTGRVRPQAVGPALGGLRCEVTSTTPHNSPVNKVVRARFAVLTPPTSLDSDGDGLSDAFETRYRLNPNNAQLANGAGGDPDNDGQANLEEQSAGTHPRGISKAYFAEGATGTFFGTRLALVHPVEVLTEPAIVQVRYLRPAPLAPVVQEFTLPLRQRHTIDVGAIAGLENTAVSIVVESDHTVVADRTMSWNTSGYGSHGETGVRRPGIRWFLAEGSTVGGFNLFYLLQNPSSIETRVTVRYLRPAPQPVITRTYTLAPNSRQNIWVNLEDPGLASTDVSAEVTSANTAIIVERAMYRDTQGQLFGAGHAGAAASQALPRWSLAEGATGPFFDLFILLANPGDTSADVRLEYLKPDGTVITKTRTLAANSRDTVWVDFEDPALANTAVSTVVTSTNNVPIVVERAMWWPGDSSTWHEAHVSLGAIQSGFEWAMAEGQVGGATRDEETYILIANVDAFDGVTDVTLYFEDGTSLVRSFPTTARSRLNVHVRTEFPGAVGRRFSSSVKSREIPGQGRPRIIVEQAMYWTVGSQIFAAGSNMVATLIQ